MSRQRAVNAQHGADGTRRSQGAAPKDWRRTLTWAELPPWLKDNQFIRTGYRQPTNSYKRCAQSVYSFWHNETVNIWTHLLGGTTAFVILMYAALRRDPHEDMQRLGWHAYFALVNPFSLDENWIDGASFVVFFVSAILCLSFSATFHTLSCHSQSVAAMYNRFDYAGIAVLISGTFAPLLRFGFYCKPYLQLVYLGVIYASSLAVIWVVVAPHQTSPEYRRLRTWLFIGLGLSSIGPIAHGFLHYGFQAAADTFSFKWTALGGLLYIIGAVLYAERVPERFKPGAFDYMGSSHQIFHVLILLACWTHYVAAAEAFRFRHGELGGVCDAIFD